MRVSQVPTYSEGPRTILDLAPANLTRRPFVVTDPPRRFTTLYTDAAPAALKRCQAAAARRRAARVAALLDAHRRAQP